MSSQALSPDAARSSQGRRAAATVDARQVANLWWLWLVTGIAWIIAALVVLQFDAASIKTIGVIVGCMFIFAGVQQLTLALIGRGWLWAVVAGFFWIAGVVCIVNPEETFAGLADTLGFLFAVVAIWWTVEAVIAQPEGGLWWIGLIAGILMFIIAFWVVHEPARRERQLRGAVGQRRRAECPTKLRQVPAQRAERIVGAGEHQLGEMLARGVANAAQDEVGEQPPGLVAARPRHGRAVALEVRSAEQMDGERHRGWDDPNRGDCSQ